MDNNLILSTCVAFVYLVFKIIETKVVKKEKKEIKDLLKDTMIVFVSTYLGGLIINKINGPILGGQRGGGVGEATQAFTGDANF